MTETIVSGPVKQNKKIYLYRMAGTRRIKFCFEVDEQFTILSETAVHEAPAVMPAQGRAVDREAVMRYVEDLRRRGFIVDVNASTGQVNVLHTPDHEKEINAFMSGKVLDHPLYQEVYKEYSHGLRELQDKIADGTCTNCELGAYKRKFRERLSAILKPDAPQSTRPGQAPGSAEENAA